jgi:hypothetical protein
MSESQGTGRSEGGAGRSGGIVATRQLKMCIQIYFILCRSKNIDNPPPTGLYWIVNTEYIPLTLLNAVHAQMRVVNTLSS